MIVAYSQYFCIYSTSTSFVCNFGRLTTLLRNLNILASRSEECLYPMESRHQAICITARLKLKQISHEFTFKNIHSTDASHVSEYSQWPKLLFLALLWNSWAQYYIPQLHDFLSFWKEATNCWKSWWSSWVRCCTMQGYTAISSLKSKRPWLNANQV